MINHIEHTRLWAKVDKSLGPDACWPWQGALNSHGYGQFAAGGRQTNATRFVLEEGLGRDLRAGEMALHSCDHPWCMNPAHLHAGSALDNMREKVDRGRHRSPRGERHGRAVLSDLAAAEIRRRRAAGETGKALALEFGVSQQLVCDIAHGRRRAA